MSDPALVVGYDGSPPSRAAVRFAAQRAAAADALLVVATVHPLPPGDLNRSATDALLREHGGAAEKVLDALQADPPKELEGVRWSAIAVGAASPCKGLLDVARRDGAAEIVVATHGRGKVSALLGSVAHDLLRESEIPVLAIPPRAVAALGEETA